MVNKSKLSLFFIFSIIFFSFVYGVLTVQYKVFPFDQLRSIKQFIFPTDSKQSLPVYYYEKKSFFEQHGGNDFDVVFIGDSITDGSEWGELFPSLKIANRGIGSDRTDGILNRLESIYSTNAKKTFIMVGINDFSAKKSVKEVFDNYKIIVNKLVEHNMEVFIQSTILSTKSELNNDILDLNKRLQKFSNQTDSVYYIDLNVGLSENSLLKEDYSFDGVHLNGNGYGVWKELIKSYIQ